jgi:hypothetical protein
MPRPTGAESESCMPRLHILTACSRPDNLTALARSLSEASCEPWEVCWHLRFDLERWHVGGQKLKNDMLDQIDDGWVLIVDDDTLLHPGLLKLAGRWVIGDALVVSQQRGDGRILHAAADNVRVGEIDIGQAVIKRSLINDLRIPIDYEGDGMFLAAVLKGKPGVIYVDEVLSWHNVLAPPVAA